MTHIKVDDGTELYIQDLGEGPAIVLVAGFGLDGALWDRQVRVLCAAGHRVLCVDQRGHGRSGKPLAGYGIGELAGDLVAVLDHLGLADVTLVGHSFGGQVAFAAAAISPRSVSRLVLVGSNAVSAARTSQFPFGAPADVVLPELVQDEEQHRAASRRATLVRAFAAAPSPEVIAWLHAISLQMPSWAAVACYHSMLTTDQTHLLPEVRQPVLQVIGAHDPVHSAKGARWLRQQLNNSRLVELDRCGHFPMLEAPAEFEQALVDFIPD